MLVPLEDYHDANFYPHDKTRPGAPAAKHGTKTGNPTTNNQQEGTRMSITASTVTIPAGFKPQYEHDPTPEQPNLAVLDRAEGPRFHDHGLNLSAEWHTSTGVKIHTWVSPGGEPQTAVDDLPRLAAALLAFYDEVRAATAETVDLPFTRTDGKHNN
ncbi:hypothetical protein [Kocuria sp.]|uniref:hypothetical protein n=1 Tax=Kocuria sp. TaxID=1871328 RepID=UPI0026DEB18A|nr:hypothetical protein [Kocuria sp.]MDO5618764.1 hypothetical protein [Kocuria sp.]